MLALNFVPERAALTMRSTSAAAIWFFTGPDSFVLDMLNAQIRFLQKQEDRPAYKNWFSTRDI
jgi:hypothetical protein